jgi:Uma2 family endonuclease
VIPRDLGFVTGADGGFKLASKRVRLPDVGFIAKEHLSQLPGRFEMAPDLVVEVVSPDEDVFKKVREYIAAGTRLVWTVYPDEKTVYVFRPAEGAELRVQQFGLDDTLDGGDVLPGFTLPVREIFPEQLFRFGVRDDLRRDTPFPGFPADVLHNITKGFGSSQSSSSTPV